MGRKIKIRKRLSPDERESRLQTVRRAARTMNYDYEAAGMTEEDLLAMYEKGLKIIREAKRKGISPEEDEAWGRFYDLPLP